MSIPALPHYAKFLRENYGDEFSYDIKQSEMDNGLKKQRPNRSVAINTRKGTIRLLGHADKKSFLAWLKTIGNGTQLFNYTDPLTGQQQQCRFVNTTWPFELLGVDIWLVPCVMESLDA